MPYINKHQFVIDAVSKTIAKKTAKKVTITQYEHEATILSFEMPRYIDEQDMSLCNIKEIHYLNDKKGQGIFEITDYTINDTNITFTWGITQNVTQEAGRISFLIRFAISNPQDYTIIDYDWYTLTNSSDLTVSKGMQNGEAIIVKYADIINQWRIELLQNTIVELEQTAVSDESFGENVWTATFKDNRARNFVVRNGITPHIGENLHWFIGSNDTGVHANGFTPEVIDNTLLVSSVDGRLGVNVNSIIPNINQEIPGKKEGTIEIYGDYINNTSNIAYAHITGCNNTAVVRGRKIVNIQTSTGRIQLDDVTDIEVGSALLMLVHTTETTVQTLDGVQQGEPVITTWDEKLRDSPIEVDIAQNTLVFDISGQFFESLNGSVVETTDPETGIVTTVTTAYDISAAPSGQEVDLDVMAGYWIIALVAKLDPNETSTDIKRYYVPSLIGTELVFDENYDFSAFVAGVNNNAGIIAFASGKGTIAFGTASHTEGWYTTALGERAHAEGYRTSALGNESHAEGGYAHADGFASHAEGWGTQASGYASHSEGNKTIAVGKGAHAEGGYNTAYADYAHVQGKYAINDVDKQYVHIVGWGTSSARKNIHTIDQFGNAWFSGTVDSSKGGWFKEGLKVGGTNRSDADYVISYALLSCGEYSQPDKSTSIAKFSNSKRAFFPTGIVCGRDGWAGGVWTKGIIGVTEPDTDGKCSRGPLYINYNSTNTYDAGLHLLLQASKAGTHYGNNLYQYAAARGDAVKAYVDTKITELAEANGLILPQ